MLLRGLAQGTFLNTFVHGFEIKRNILHFIAHAVADIGAERIRQRVEFRKATHLHAALVTSAGGEHRSTRECRSKKDFFHCCFNYVLSLLLFARTKI